MEQGKNFPFIAIFQGPGTVFACNRGGWHHWRSTLLFQGQRLLPHIRDQVWVRQGAHLLDPLHHRVLEEVAEVFQQGSRPAGDVQPGHCQIRHPRRPRISFERNVPATDQSRDGWLDEAVLPPTEARNRTAAVWESVWNSWWKTLQVVDLLCQEKVHGEVPERTWRHELRRNFKHWRILSAFFHPHLSQPHVNNKHHICDSLIDLPTYDKYSYQKYLEHIWQFQKCCREEALSCWGLFTPHNPIFAASCQFPFLNFIFLSHTPRSHNFHPHLPQGSSWSLGSMCVEHSEAFSMLLLLDRLSHALRSL